MARHSLFFAALVSLSLGSLWTPASAQNIPAYVATAVNDKNRPAADTMRDAARKPAESVAFSGVKPGDKVADFIAGGGYFTRIFSKVVGAQGHVYATETGGDDDGPPGGDANGSRRGDADGARGGDADRPCGG